MNLPKLKIGNLAATFPIIQGGMGIGISLNKLAGAVSKCGGIGILSGVQIGFKEPDFLTNPLEANLRALEKEIHLARATAPSGILGLNLMVPMRHYAELVKKAIACNIDLIISGAGLPLDLPNLAKGSTTKLIPIVSSKKACDIICKMWDRKHQTAPDAIVVEGPLAGGHLGFKPEALESHPDVIAIAKEVKESVVPFEEKYQKSIPVIVAGGIYNASDIKKVLEEGLDGVQMGTRFVTTFECDAPLSYKDQYLHATEDTIGIIKSPVGMPGRAILNDFIKHPKGNSTCLYHCLSGCSITDIPYCISEALINAVTEKTDDALLFCGSNAYRAKELEYVKDIFTEIQSAFS